MSKISERIAAQIEATRDPTLPKPSRFPSDFALETGAVIAAMSQDGEPVATGISWLDGRLRRGGLTQGRVILFGGPPFAGKTNIVVDAALNLALRVPVFAVFQDEGRTQAAVRLGVMLGVGVEEIETDPAKAATRVTELAAERSLFLIQPDSDFANADDVFDFVAERVPKGETAVVVFDSVQTIPAHREMEGFGDKAKIDEFMRVTRGRAESDRRIVLATSQGNRASYRSRSKEENSVGMASFSGSSSIEYLADFGLTLSLPDEDSEMVACEVVKNRLGHFGRGKKLPKKFAIRYDEETGRMLELDQAQVEEASATAAVARLAPAKSTILDALKKLREGATGAKLQELTQIRRGDVFAGLKVLVSEGKVYVETKGRAVSYVYDSSREP